MCSIELKLGLPVSVPLWSILYYRTKMQQNILAKSISSIVIVKNIEIIMANNQAISALEKAKLCHHLESEQRM